MDRNGFPSAQKGRALNQFGLFELRLSPEIVRGQDRYDFKVDQIIPAADPSIAARDNLKTLSLRHAKTEISEKG